MDRPVRLWGGLHDELNSFMGDGVNMHEGFELSYRVTPKYTRTNKLLYVMLYVVTVLITVSRLLLTLFILFCYLVLNLTETVNN